MTSIPSAYPTFTAWRSGAAVESGLTAALGAEARTVTRGLAFAQHWQSGQHRPGGEPNIEHLWEVVEILVRGAQVRDHEILAAAAAHDVVEHSLCTLTDVRHELGPRVAGLVATLTDPTSLPGETPDATRARYLRRIATATPDVVEIKLADRYSNVQRLHLHPDPCWQRSYYRETCRIIMPLARDHPFFAAAYAAWRSHYAGLGG